MFLQSRKWTIDSSDNKWLSRCPNLVRCFVSSTFRDMSAERNTLVTRVFPALRQYCQKRGLACAEIDLRWGITEEQAERGDTLPVCLAEIERCNLFIAILGSCYGTRFRDLQGIDSSTVRRQCPWVERYRDRSVTELEILHAVLGDSPRCGNALFYFRRPDEQTWDSNAEDQRLLNELKTRILSSGAFVRQGYRDADELATWISADLEKTVDALFPPVARERCSSDPKDHTGTTHKYCLRRLWVGRASWSD